MATELQVFVLVQVTMNNPLIRASLNTNNQYRDKHWYLYQ